MGAALFVGGHGIHQPAVHLSDLKGDIGDALISVRLIDLDQLQPARALINKGEGLAADSALDLNALGGGVQHHAVGHMEFLSGDDRPRLQIGEYNAAIHDEKNGVLKEAQLYETHPETGKKDM